MIGHTWVNSEVLVLQLPDSAELMALVRTPEVMIAAAALFIGVLLLTVMLSRYLNRTADARLLKNILARHCEAVELGAVLPDGLDGFMFVDYLLLLRGKIMALKVLSRKGVVLGLADGDEWTCIENNRSEKFTNPLPGLKQSVHQMRHVLNFKDIDACVLFGSESRFPKGAPEGTLQLVNLDSELVLRKGDESGHERTREIWDRLIEMNHQARQELKSQLSA